jgi:hypothetical protein
MNDVANNKLVMLSRKLDEKRDTLTQKLKILKNDYFQILSKNNSPDSTNHAVRVSMMEQIEILIELIKTTKLKISLMQQIDEDFASGGSAGGPIKTNLPMDI